MDDVARDTCGWSFLRGALRFGAGPQWTEATLDLPLKRGRLRYTPGVGMLQCPPAAPAPSTDPAPLA